MTRKINQNYLLVSLNICFALGWFAYTFSTCSAQERNDVWEVGLNFQRLQLKDDKNNLVGNGGIFQIGMGGIIGSWHLSAAADIVLGPFTSLRKERVKTDFYGTGATISSRYTFSEKGARTMQGTGVSLKLSYADIVGRSIQNSIRTSDNREVSELIMRTSTFMGYVGIFISWIRDIRPVGNTTELLKTRVEGYILSFDFGYPLKSAYSTTYQETEYEEDSDEVISSQKKRERGAHNGYSIRAALTILLGS